MCASHNGQPGACADMHTLLKICLSQQHLLASVLCTGTFPLVPALIPVVVPDPNTALVSPPSGTNTGGAHDTVELETPTPTTTTKNPLVTGIDPPPPVHALLSDIRTCVRLVEETANLSNKPMGDRLVSTTTTATRTSTDEGSEPAQGTEPTAPTNRASHHRGRAANHKRARTPASGSTPHSSATTPHPPPAAKQPPLKPLASDVALWFFAEHGFVFRQVALFLRCVRDVCVHCDGTCMRLYRDCAELYVEVKVPFPSSEMVVCPQPFTVSVLCANFTQMCSLIHRRQTCVIAVNREMTTMSLECTGPTSSTREAIQLSHLVPNLGRLWQIYTYKSLFYWGPR
jgi:hypothetical protein